jgi:hypothetical protein
MEMPSMLTLLPQTVCFFRLTLNMQSEVRISAGPVFRERGRRVRACLSGSRRD